jgi:hypothetical protein
MADAAFQEKQTTVKLDAGLTLDKKDIMVHDQAPDSGLRLKIFLVSGNLTILLRQSSCNVWNILWLCS